MALMLVLLIIYSLCAHLHISAPLLLSMHPHINSEPYTLLLQLWFTSQNHMNVSPLVLSYLYIISITMFFWNHHGDTQGLLKGKNTTVL